VAVRGFRVQLFTQCAYRDTHKRRESAYKWVRGPFKKDVHFFKNCVPLYAVVRENAYTGGARTRRT
jgi:hypothetical protein